MNMIKSYSSAAFQNAAAESLGSDWEELDLTVAQGEVPASNAYFLLHFIL